MGAVSPVPFADDEFMKKVKERVIEPTVKGLQEEHFEYRGFVFFGLINVNGEPFVIEYNCRMGDPETEVVIPRLQNDLVELFLAASQQRLSEIEVRIDPRAAATVVAVSGGYPGNYEKGFEIDGLDILQEDDVIIFHAGTAKQDDVVVTNGGRVLAVTSFGDSVAKAARRSSDMMEFLDFHGIYYRRDIGYEFV
jgi:phosphoribosylamine---glycine ligase